MNYLWEILIGSKEQGLDTSNLKFKLPGSYSPYMEYAGPILNLQKIEDMNVEINPYYRFLNIFKELFPPDGGEFEELRESLLNLSMHLLGVGDVKQGISKIDYYKRLLYKDILAGCFDDEVAKNILLFDKMERNQLLGGLLRLYSTGTSITLLTEMISTFFANSIVYLSNDSAREILIYIGHKQTEKLEKKVNLILHCFSDFSYRIEVYYEYHFGIMGIEDTMVLDEIAMYESRE